MTKIHIVLGQAYMAYNELNFDHSQPRIRAWNYYCDHRNYWRLIHSPLMRDWVEFTPHEIPRSPLGKATLVALLQVVSVFPTGRQLNANYHNATFESLVRMSYGYFRLSLEGDIGDSSMRKNFKKLQKTT